MKNNENDVKENLDEVLMAEETIAVEKEFIRDEEIKKDGKFLHYTRVLLSGIVDQIFSVALALILFGLTSLILRLFGYYILMKDEVFLITYIISNVLYYPLTAEFIHGKTLGKKIIIR